MCAMLPDVDVIGFSFGVRYGDLLGHRGLTHSIAFAAAVASICITRGVRLEMTRMRAWIYLFLATVSHGMLDAATNGGLGVAFFSPLSNRRFFWPWRPLVVSPIGLNFFQSSRAVDVIYGELLWLWLPTGVALLIAYVWSLRNGGR